MSNIIYIMGKSASGKDTIFEKIKEKINVNIYVPYTTRPKRDGEEQGREYFFITREQFENLQKQNKVMEYRNYNTLKANGEKDIWTYATVEDNQWKKRGDFLAIGTLESYVSITNYLKDKHNSNLRMLPVYIEINEEERRKRATIRENKQEIPNFHEMERRLKVDNIDFSQEKLKQAGITKNQTFENYNLDDCVKQIITYVENNRDEKER